MIKNIAYPFILLFALAQCQGISDSKTDCNATLNNKQTQQQINATTTNQPSEIVTVNGVSFKMIRVEGDSTGTFYIGETEVTQELWQAVMGDNPSSFKGSQRPVENVSWNDCKEFIRKLNSLTGETFRLPKESEWEYAAKGGNKSKRFIFSGSNDIDDVAWYWKNSGDEYLSGTDDDWNWDRISSNNSKTHPVKQKQPNELGIYDMSGNVFEWCENLYDSSDSIRVLCGGDWGCWDSYCCVMYSTIRPQSDRSYTLGFRLAR